MLNVLPRLDLCKQKLCKAGLMHLGHLSLSSEVLLFFATTGHKKWDLQVNLLYGNRVPRIQTGIPRCRCAELSPADPTVSYQQMNSLISTFSHMEKIFQYSQKDQLNKNSNLCLQYRQTMDPTLTFRIPTHIHQQLKETNPIPLFQSTISLFCFFYSCKTTLQNLSISPRSKNWQVSHGNCRA